MGMKAGAAHGAHLEFQRDRGCLGPARTLRIEEKLGKRSWVEGARGGSLSLPKA